MILVSFVLLCIIATLILVVIIKFDLILVSGCSMLPTLIDGDILVSKKLLKSEDFVIGDVFIFRDPEGKRVVKRLKSKSLILGKLWFEGDNRLLSHDSRSYGWVNVDSVEGKVVKILNRRGELN